MTQIIRVTVESRWLAIVAATIIIAACKGGPAATSAAAPTGSPPVTSSAGQDQNTDGSALTNLTGYRIYYGTGANALTEVVEVPTVGITAYVIDNLTAGTYYFSIRAYNSAGIESTLSNIVSDTIG